MKEKSNIENIPFDLIARIFTSEAGKEDIDRLNEWLNESEQNRKDFRQLEEIWQKTGQIPAEERFDIDIDQEWKKFSLNKSSHKTKSLAVLPVIYRLAAVIILGLLLSYTAYIIINNIRYTRFVAENEVERFVLPDSSIVFLNAGSEIVYRKNFGGETRQIELSGEAFFDVRENRSKPFVVVSSEVMIKVLGTSFNLDTGEGSGKVELVVETGIVSMTIIENKQEEIFSSGESAKYLSEQNKLIRSEVPDNYKSWLTGILAFDDADLEEVAATLEKVYRISVKVSPEVADCHITVNFDNKSFGYVLETIAATLDLEIEEKGGVIYLNGEGC